MRRTIRVVGFAMATLYLLGIGSASASITINGPFEWAVADGGNGHFYSLVIPETNVESFTWLEARVAAESSFYRGSIGQLVSVNSADEDNFLRTNFSSYLEDNYFDDDPSSSWGDPWTGPWNSTYAWIGLFAPTPTSDFEWTTGEAVDYTNWAPAEPNLFDDYRWQYTHYWTRNFDEIFGTGGDPTWGWNNDENGGFHVLDQNNRYGYIVEYSGPFSPVPEPASLAVWSLLGVVGYVTVRRRKRR